MLIVPATQEVEAKELFEPRNLRPDLATLQDPASKKGKKMKR
jgi:hypothetical protein